MKERKQNAIHVFLTLVNVTVTEVTDCFIVSSHHTVGRHRHRPGFVCCGPGGVV